MYTDRCYGCPVRDGKVTHDIIVIVKPNLLIPTKDALSPREGRVAKQLLSTSIQQTIENMKEEEYRLKFRKDSLSAELRNSVRKTLKSRTKKKKFDLGTINVEHDLDILKFNVSDSMSTEYSYRKGTLGDFDPLLGSEWDVMRGKMSCSFVTSVKVNITPTLHLHMKVKWWGLSGHFGHWKL